MDLKKFRDQSTIRSGFGEELFDRLYNKYVEYYNSNHIRALADFKAIYESLIERIEHKQFGVKRYIELFEHDLNDYRIRLSEKYEEDEEKFADLEYWINEIEQFVKSNIPYPHFDPERRPRNEVLDEVFSIMSKVHNSLNESEYKGHGFDNLQDAYKNLEVLEKIILHRIVLGAIKDKVIDEGYPKELKTLDNISKEEKRKLKKELDKTNQHIHRKEDIVQKYNDLRKKYSKKSDLQIRNLVQEWYYELTPGDKSINEGTIRYYLEEK